MKIQCQLFECEHNQDLNNMRSDIINSGGRILSEMPDFDNETAHLVVEVDNKDDFIMRLCDTSSEGLIEVF